MSKNKVLVLIDNQNIYMNSIDELPDRRLDYGKLKKFILGNRDCLRVVAFVVDDGTNNAQRIFGVMKDIGFELQVKPLKIFVRDWGIKKKGDCDVNIAVEAMRALYTKEDFDTVALVSGDGDFVVLVKELQKFGKRVEVFSWQPNMADELFNACDKYYNLSEVKDAVSVLHTHFV